MVVRSFVRPFARVAQRGLVTRRSAILLPVVPAFSLAGCLGRSLLADGDTHEVEPGDAGVDSGTDAGGDAGAKTCLVRPAQTPGPYFLDEMLERSDIRDDPTTGQVKDGVPLRVAFSVFWARVDGCEPIENAVVDLWQCDAFGQYGDVLDSAGAFDTRGQLWLRGFQRTDAAGRVAFRTIYPGWYPGRAVHLHFKVRLGDPTAPSLDFTSQLYFFETVNDAIMAEDPYASRGARSTLNIQDGIYTQSGGRDLVLSLEPEADGYAGEFDLGLAVG
jgi:protocatechuate 3,4-dioxygenase beta subunit